MAVVRSFAEGNPPGAPVGGTPTGGIRDQRDERLDCRVGVLPDKGHEQGRGALHRRSKLAGEAGPDQSPWSPGEVADLRVARGQDPEEFVGTALLVSQLTRVIVAVWASQT